MTIQLRREIPTRLLEACYREARALFDPSGLGYKGRIFPYPVMAPGSVTPRQINIVNMVPDYTTGVGGTSDTEYGIEFCFFFPVNLVMFRPGENTYLDEITLLRRWLYAGGTVPNRNGRLRDPDNASGWINTEIRHYTWLPPALTPGNAAIEVPVHVLFGTTETADGVRP